MAHTFDYRLKLLTIGDSGVGKTCLLSRYTNDLFSPLFLTTIGIDFKTKTVDLDGDIMMVQIWDTAGQEKFKVITRSYFRGAHGVLLVYDVSDRESFDHVTEWIAEIGEHGDSNVSMILVGNKCDIDPKKIVVSEEEASTLAKEFGIKHILTSAKNNINVTEAFDSIARDVRTRLQQAAVPKRLHPGPKPIDIHGNSTTRSPCCSGGSTSTSSTKQ